MAVSLIESMTTPWDPSNYHDTYRERVEQLIEDKRQGREVVTEAEAPEPTGMSDLLQALQRSVDAARAGRTDSASSGEEKSSGEKKKGSGSRPRAGSGRGGGDRTTNGDRATKAELQRQARELQISGRSSMNRDELAQAIEQAERRAS
jgi:DNA end-binding protein Ku